jgi:DNA-binding NtrC family response regulator
MKEFLHFCGHSCTTAVTPDQAFNLLRSRPQQFEVVITDCWEPETNGGQVVQQLKKEESALSIIVTRARALQNHATEPITSQEVTVLQKPFEGRELQQALERIQKNRTGLNFEAYGKGLREGERGHALTA